MKEVHPKYYGVKEAVFPFNMFQEVDPVLGPEMRSTGEVLGLSLDVGEAYFKAQEATKTELPTGAPYSISLSSTFSEIITAEESSTIKLTVLTLGIVLI